MELTLEELQTPMGTVSIVMEGKIVRAIDYFDCNDRMQRLLKKHYGTYGLHPRVGRSKACDLLQDYFDGDLGCLNQIEIATNGTEFQRRVWSILRQIPESVTVTYGWIAQQLGQPTASRAVGLANGANPISIVVPCHRVIGADRTLTGYAGGIAKKKWLLEHEGASVPSLAKGRRESLVASCI